MCSICTLQVQRTTKKNTGCVGGGNCESNVKIHETILQPHPDHKLTNKRTLVLYVTETTLPLCHCESTYFSWHGSLWRCIKRRGMLLCVGNKKKEEKLKITRKEGARSRDIGSRIHFASFLNSWNPEPSPMWRAPNPLTGPLLNVAGRAFSSSRTA